MSLRLSLLAASLASLLLIASGCSNASASKSKPSVEHGRYLVDQVAMCADCHGPRGPDGQLIEDKWLQGSQLGFAATVPVPNWATFAPSIAGLNHYSDAELISLFTTGSFPDGRQLRLPMPHFRLSESDAASVVAYLRSLPAGF